MSNAFESERSRILSLTKSDRLAEAEAALEALREIYVHEPEFWSTFAHVASRRGDMAQALRGIDAAIELQPHEGAYYFARGRYRLKAGDAARAVEDFTRVLDLSTEAEDAYYVEMTHLLRAKAYLDMGALAQARADCLEVHDDGVVWVGGKISKGLILAECVRRGGKAR